MITPALPAPRAETDVKADVLDVAAAERDPAGVLDPYYPYDSVDSLDSLDSLDRFDTLDESITAWALAARTGDQVAVERFVHALHRDVRRYVAHLCADPQAVDDLAQDTFLRALGSLHRFEGRSSARSWLLSIARRAVIDGYRYAAARPRQCDAPDWEPAAERAQPRGLPGFDDGVVLLDLLSALPDERREAFILTQLLGLPYAEAAALSDCPVGTVRSRVARARATLVDQLTDADTVLMA